VADLERVEHAEVRDLADRLGGGVRPRVGGEQPVGVREEHEQVGAEQNGDLGGEEVVVAEGDLVRRRRVVLVDDGDDPPIEQRAQVRRALR
jgi:hypothetical protein